MANKSVEKPDLNFILSHRAPNAIRSDSERNLIGRRTQSDRAADGERWFKFALLCPLSPSRVWSDVGFTSQIAVFANSILHICDF